jgi:hypothetical protein
MGHWFKSDLRWDEILAVFGNAGGDGTARMKMFSKWTGRVTSSLSRVNFGVLFSNAWSDLF